MDLGGPTPNPSPSPAAIEKGVVRARCNSPPHPHGWRGVGGGAAEDGILHATTISTPLAKRCFGMAGTEPGYFRYPTIHEDTIVFVSEDDLWMVPAEGGRAWRL